MTIDCDCDGGRKQGSGDGGTVVLSKRTQQIFYSLIQNKQRTKNIEMAKQTNKEMR